MRGETNDASASPTLSHLLVELTQQQGCGMCGGNGCGSRDMNAVAATVPGGVPVGAKSSEYCCNSGVDERKVTCGTGEGQGYPPCFIEFGEYTYCGFPCFGVCVRGGGGETFFNDIPRGRLGCVERRAAARSIPPGVEDSDDEKGAQPFGWALSLLVAVRKGKAFVPPPSIPSRNGPSHTLVYEDNSQATTTAPPPCRPSFGLPVRNRVETVSARCSQNIRWY